MVSTQLDQLTHRRVERVRHRAAEDDQVCPEGRSHLTRVPHRHLNSEEVDAPAVLPERKTERDRADVVLLCGRARQHHLRPSSGAPSLRKPQQPRAQDPRREVLLSYRDFEALPTLAQLMEVAQYHRIQQCLELDLGEHTVERALRRGLVEPLKGPAQISHARRKRRVRERFEPIFRSLHQLHRRSLLTPHVLATTESISLLWPTWGRPSRTRGSLDRNGWRCGGRPRNAPPQRRLTSSSRHLGSAVIPEPWPTPALPRPATKD